jgi:hypothetical protein
MKTDTLTPEQLRKKPNVVNDTELTTKTNSLSQSFIYVHLNRLTYRRTQIRDWKWKAIQK